MFLIINKLALRYIDLKANYETKHLKSFYKAMKKREILALKSPTFWKSRGFSTINFLQFSVFHTYGKLL